MTSQQADIEMLKEKYRRRVGSIYRIFNQDQVWADATGRIWVIEKMDKLHLDNLIAFLEEHAAVLEFYYSWQEINPLPNVVGGYADDFDALWDIDFESEWEERMSDPLAWLASTTLMQKLKSVYEKWESDHQFASFAGFR